MSAIDAMHKGLEDLTQLCEVVLTKFEQELTK